MAAGSIAVLVNREAMGKALALARQECQAEKAWLNAVNRAALNLEACQWQFDGHTLIVKSATEQHVHYTVTSDGCECKAFEAGRPCWHRAARRLLIKAAELAQIPTPRNTCPACGALIEAVPYVVNHHSYAYFEICAGDGVHLSKVLMPAQAQQPEEEASHV